MLLVIPTSSSLDEYLLCKINDYKVSINRIILNERMNIYIVSHRPKEALDSISFLLLCLLVLRYVMNVKKALI